MFYVYVLQSKGDRKLYTGFTNNLRDRVIKHNAGKVFSTKSRRPLRCIYVEICLNEQDAKKREKYLKTGIGKRFLKYRLHCYFKGQESLLGENTSFPTGLEKKVGLAK